MSSFDDKETTTTMAEIPATSQLIPPSSLFKSLTKRKECCKYIASKLGIKHGACVTARTAKKMKYYDADANFDVLKSVYSLRVGMNASEMRDTCGGTTGKVLRSLQHPDLQAASMNGIFMCHSLLCTLEKQQKKQYSVTLSGKD